MPYKVAMRPRLRQNAPVRERKYSRWWRERPIASKLNASALSDATFVDEKLLALSKRSVFRCNTILSPMSSKFAPGSCLVGMSC